MYVIRTDECFYCRETRQRWFYINMYTHHGSVPRALFNYIRLVRICIRACCILCTDIHIILYDVYTISTINVFTAFFVAPVREICGNPKMFFPSFYLMTQRRSRLRPRHRQRRRQRVRANAEQINTNY